MQIHHCSNFNRFWVCLTILSATVCPVSRPETPLRPSTKQETIAVKNKVSPKAVECQLIPRVFTRWLQSSGALVLGYASSARWSDVIKVVRDVLTTAEKTSAEACFYPSPVCTCLMNGFKTATKFSCIQMVVRVSYRHGRCPFNDV